MAQAQRADTYDYIAAIIDELKSQTFKRNQIELAVRREIELLTDADDSEHIHLGRQTENLKYADEISELLRELLKKINSAPEGTQQALYSWGLYREKFKPPAIDWHEVGRYKLRFLFYAESMGQACSLIKRTKFGTHHNVKPMKRHYAQSAFNLIVGLDAGRPTNSSENSPLRIIASHLCTVVAPTDEGGDLRLQCEEVVSYWRHQPQSEWENLKWHQRRVWWNLHE